MAYIYRHIKPNGQTFYIGIGKVKSRLLSKSNRNKHWHNTVNKYGYEAQILKDNISWNEACELEKMLILWYGRVDARTGILVNMTDGGEGVLGLKHNIGHTGKKHSEETKNRISKSKIGTTPWNKGLRNIYTKATIRKISNAKKGKGKLVLNLETGIYYDSATEASYTLNMNRSTLMGYLNNCRPNKSPFIYV